MCGSQIAMTAAVPPPIARARRESPMGRCGRVPWLLVRGLHFVGLPRQKDIVFRFIIEYSSFRDFGP